MLNRNKLLLLFAFWLPSFHWYNLQTVLI